MRNSVSLLDNANATGDWVSWPGGRASVITDAAFAGGTLQLQLKTKLGNAIDIGNSIGAAGKQDYDLPAGEYRMQVASGSPTGVYADIVSVPYT